MNQSGSQSFIQLSVSQSVSQRDIRSICLSIPLSVHLSVCPSVQQSNRCWSVDFFFWCSDWVNKIPPCCVVVISNSAVCNVSDFNSLFHNWNYLQYCSFLFDLFQSVSQSKNAYGFEGSWDMERGWGREEWTKFWMGMHSVFMKLSRWTNLFFILTI